MSKASLVYFLLCNPDVIMFHHTKYGGGVNMGYCIRMRLHWGDIHPVVL